MDEPPPTKESIHCIDMRRSLDFTSARTYIDRSYEFYEKVTVKSNFLSLFLFSSCVRWSVPTILLICRGRQSQT